MIGGENAFRAAPLRLEGKETIPRAHIQNGLSLQAPRQRDPVQPRRRVVHTFGPDPVPQVDGVVPPDLLGSRLELFRALFGGQ
jgi:hypothetical protein